MVIKKEALSLGIDTGGTFTDLTAIDESGRLRIYKSPTTPQDYTIGIVNCLKQCADDYSLDLKEFFRRFEVFVVHGCTIATNTVVQWKGAKVGIICTMGHSSVLWKREANKIQDIFNFYIPWPKPLVPTYLCLEVTERLNSEGGVEVPLDEESVRRAVRQLKDWDVESIGVCLLWSILNSTHERRVGEIIEEEWPGIPYSLSSDVQPIIREYHRTSCVALDAMLKPIMSDYAKNFNKTLESYGYKREFLMVVSTGGIMTASEAIKKPVYTLFSGPAMGPTAGLFFAKHEGTENCVVIDMGGTSFDVSTVIDGMPTITREAQVSGHPTGVTSIDVLTLGAGGGSIAWVDKGGMLHVGPESAGAQPGPACYGVGGKEPTVTDANVVLGYINPDYFWGGRMKISSELAQKAIEQKVAQPLKQDIGAAASGIYRVVNENMVGGILEMTLRRGIDPREFLLIAGGGATAIHAARLAQELDMKKILIPRVAPVLCAMGMLNADVTFSEVGSMYTNSANFDFDSVNNLLDSLKQRAQLALEREGIALKNRKFEYYAAAKYLGQPYTIDFSLRGGVITSETLPQIIDDFHAVYKKRFTVSDPTSVIEFTDWRVLGIGVMPRPSLEEQTAAGGDASKALKGKRNAYFESVGGFTEVPIYDGAKLLYGMKVEGPAIIEDELTTTVVIPNSQVTVDKFGSYIIELS
jgi:N-methylhydantoinase A